MPRRQSIPSYRLHKPTGQARVIIDGRHVYLGAYGSNEPKAGYERLVRKLLIERAAVELEANVRVSTDLTVAELAERSIKFARTYYVKRGRVTPEYDHIRSAIGPVVRLHGAELATAFGPLKLEAIRQAWIDGGLVRVHINERIGRVRRMFSCGVEEEMVPPNTWSPCARSRGCARGDPRRLRRGATPAS